MASDWIKMRTDLAGDPAVIAIAAKLGMDDDHVVGKLHKIWSWADAQTTDGLVPGVTAKWVDKYLGCKGFAEAMRMVGWLIVSESGIEFPRFDKHNGKSAKRRAEAAERARLSREECDEMRTESARKAHQRREEKRREEEACASASEKYKNQASEFSIAGSGSGSEASVSDWLRRHNIDGPLAAHVQATPGLTASQLDVAKAKARGRCNNPAAIACHRVCKRLGRPIPKSTFKTLDVSVQSLLDTVNARRGGMRV